MKRATTMIMIRGQAWPIGPLHKRRASARALAANFLKQKSYETYLPKIITKAGARERVVPLFPGYIFVRIDIGWYEARWSPRRVENPDG